MAVSSIGRRRVLWAVAVITYFQRLGIAVRGQSRIHVAASLRAHCSLATMMPGQLFAERGEAEPDQDIGICGTQIMD